MVVAMMLVAAPAPAQGILHLSVPANTPGSTPIYVAGSFNNWNPGDAAFTLTKQADGSYAITLPAAVKGKVEFKFTLGSWDKVEVDSSGRDVPNRSFTFPDTGTATYNGTVASWRDGSPRPTPAHSARASVAVLDTAFVMPELGRTRRVWIYLPPGYATSDRRYAVLYMHDGQNVFDAATSFAGEWGVDETLDRLRGLGDSGAIVVAVDNGSSLHPLSPSPSGRGGTAGTNTRMDEYDPWVNPKYGGGEGDKYVDFLAHTLKPYIDAHYRTQGDRAHTGVAGSSMGGLISLYAALKYPDVFGRVGVFSPAFWVAPAIFDYARHAHALPGTRIYMVMGGKEGDTPDVYVRDARLMADTLRAAGFDSGGSAVISLVKPDGTHSEGFWQREFPAAYEWLFQSSPLSRRERGSGGEAATWTHGATCYEVFVRSFYDSNGDGVGDLNGLTQKLDYIKGLGASCIWLMPIMVSPSYHGYDVADYYKVEPAYGTNADFKRLVAAAHARGIAVLIDMVLNHTSNENPWFKAALTDTASPYRSWYRFSPTDLGRGPWGSPAWHKSPVRDEYYYGIFWSGMPDLNYDTPAVEQETEKIADYWLRDMGVDGFRLDAVPYLVEEGTCLMGCPGTHMVLRAYSDHLKSVKPDVYTVGEVWSNIDAMLPYYPDQLTSYFGFELADSLVAAVRPHPLAPSPSAPVSPHPLAPSPFGRGGTQNLLSGFLRLQDTLPPYRFSPFLSNHDGTRVMTLLGNDIARAKQAATLLLTLPGLPFVYYGEEIGMTGDKPDERLRTPMQWAPRTGVGFTTGKEWEVPQGDSLTRTVALEDRDPRSLLNLYRRLIHLRKANEALATGRLVPLSTASSHVAAYLRKTAGRAVVVVTNLSDSAVAGVTISSADSVLPRGRYVVKNLLGGRTAAALSVGADGKIQGYVPRSSLGPRESLVLDLSFPFSK
jgi:alpha-amylase